MTYETNRFDVLIEIQHIDSDLSFIVRFKFAPRCCIYSTDGGEVREWIVINTDIVVV
jgi:hypothetical protein